MNLDGLDEFCTVRQLEYVEAIRKHGSLNKAAEALGVARGSIQDSLRHVRNKAAHAGFSPEHDMTHIAPPGYIVKGASTYYDKTGKPAGQWVKTTIDYNQVEQMMRDAANAMADELPRLKPIAKPARTNDDLCNLYVLTDCHVGMLAWHKEGGADWDLHIAEKTLSDCFELMVTSAPAARSCVIAQLGDWLHQDGMLPVTPTSGHILDADGRFSKVVQASIRILRRVVDFALSKHETVNVLMAEGNHDLSSSIWLRCMFKALYENEPRVVMIDSELPYYAHQHGETMLGFHHGHLKKNDTLPLLFAAQFPKLWGDTGKRYIHTGHWHHVEEKEHAGVTVVQHPTLAARDAYAARNGYISERQVTATTYHKKHGRVGTVTVTPEMI